MKENNFNLIPVLLGADLNAYSVAVAFHSAYGVKSHAFGRYRCGLSDFSRIVKIEFCSGYESIDVFLPELISFAEKNKGKFLVLIPCADCYVEFVNKHEKKLSEFYRFLVPKGELVKKLTDKASFYRELTSNNIEHPEFIELNEGDNYLKKLGKVNYPMVLKPSCSAEYWRHPFPGMRKVYYPKDKNEAASVIGEIRYYGYRDGIIIQRKIEPSETFVYTGLFNEKSECDFGVFGKVVLEERGKTSEGNHSAIITEEKNELCFKLDNFLKGIQYSGFANFDILKSGDKYYVLELNARQGRSSDYIRCAGINIAKRLISVLGIREEGKAPPYDRIFWHYPPLKTTLRFMGEKDKKDAQALKNSDRAFSALKYGQDLFTNPRRAAYVLIHGRRLNKSFERDFLSK